MLAGDFFLDQDEPVALLFGWKRGEDGDSASGQHDGPAPGPPPCGVEGLVQVDVHRVDAQVTWADLADDGVEVGAVAIGKAARRMHASEIAFMSGSNRPQMFGLVIITPAASGPSRDFKAIEIDPTVCVGGDVLDPIASKGRGRGVGAVRFPAPRHLARIAARLERRADAQQPAQLAVGAGLGLIRDVCMPVRVSSQWPTRSISSSAPWTVSTGWSRWMSAKPKPSDLLVERGLCFIVHEPARQPRSIA